jgi:hypothetical protein
MLGLMLLDLPAGGLTDLEDVRPFVGLQGVVLGGGVAGAGQTGERGSRASRWTQSNGIQIQAR